MLFFLIITIIALIILSVLLFQSRRQLRLQQQQWEKQSTNDDCLNKILFDRSCAYLLSRTNYELVSLFLNSQIASMMQQGFPRYFKIYAKELEKAGYQSVVLLMYEDGYGASSSFREGTGVDDLVVSRKLKGYLYYDGQIYYPFSIRTLYNDCDCLFIDELNVGKIEGKGIGSFILSCIEEEAKRLGFIKRIGGNLAQKDIGHCEQLIHFYEKNGFTVEDLDAPQDGIWGKISKEI